jgi:2'-5' RNA ligase
MRRTIGVAIGIPEPWDSELVQRRIEAGDPLAEQVPPHVTLLPPTEIDNGDLGAIEEHLRTVAVRHRSFDLHLRGAGTFRPITDVVFVMVSRGISECEQLQADIRNGPLVRELHFPYHPHVTVAHDVSPAQLDAAYESLGTFDARFQVWGFTLFEHGADGHWRPQQDFPFAGAEVGPVRA